MLNYLNKLNQVDPLVQGLIKAIKIEINDQNEDIGQFVRDKYFDLCSKDMLNQYEAECGITPKASQSLSDRASAVSAKWKMSGKIDIDLIRSVASSWAYGSVDVDFANNTLKITFSDTHGIPVDEDGLKGAIEEVKPAHIPITFIYMYYTWAETKKTWAEIGQKTWYATKTR